MEKQMKVPKKKCDMCMKRIASVRFYSLWICDNCYKSLNGFPRMKKYQKRKNILTNAWRKNKDLKKIVRSWSNDA